MTIIELDKIMVCENCGAEAQADDGTMYSCKSCGFEFDNPITANVREMTIHRNYTRKSKKNKQVCKNICFEIETSYSKMGNGVAHCNTCDKYIKVDGDTRCPCCNGRLRCSARRRTDEEAESLARY